MKYLRCQAKSGSARAVSAWETENDAQEVFDAYVKRTAKRYAEGTLLTDKQTVESNTRLRWQTPEGGVAIEIRGQRVVVIEGIPEGTDDNALLTSLWK